MLKKVFAATAIALLALNVARSQDRTISGIVTSSEDGLPVAGVSVAVKGTMTGTSTKGDGSYLLTGVPDHATLEFSFIGMVTQAMIANSNRIDVVLEPDTRLLDEVLVVAYGSVRKSAFTGSATAVEQERLETPAASFDKGLAGQVAGVQVVSTSGQPGSGTSIRIRGAGSLSASNEPLYVVDGVPITNRSASDYSYLAWYADNSSNPLASLNPNDIETITVLKDAAAAALYGSRAANGVVIVTTKSGKQGNAKVNFNSSLTVSSLGKSYNMVSSSEYYKLLFEAYLGAGQTVEEANASAQGTMTHNPYNVANPLDAAGNLVNGAKVVVDTDWQDEVFSTALSQNYSVNVSGATGSTNYFASVGYTDQDGISPGADYKRYSGNINLNSQAKKWLKLGLSSNFSYALQNITMQGGAGASPLGNALGFPNAVPVYVVDSDGEPVLDAYGNKQYNFSNPVARDFNPLYNPVEDTELSKFYRMIASAYAEISFTDDLQFKTVLSPDILLTDEYRFWNKYHGNGPAYNGRYDRYHRSNLGYTATNTLNYHRLFGLGSVNLLGGMEYWQATYEHLYAGGKSLLGELKELSAAAGSFSPESNTVKETMISYFGRAEYSYRDKYNLSASVRSDGASVFGANTKWGTFWSVGANWLVNQEDFLSDNDDIDLLKLRVSYGTSGNKAGLDSYAALGLWQVDPTNKYGANSGMGHVQLANPDLSWEKQKMFNVGVDFGFRNRIHGSLEFFRKVSDGLLYDYPIAISNGFESITINAAKTMNSGVEFTLGGRVLTGELKWDADMNASFIRDKILDLHGDDDVNMPDNAKIWSVGGSQYEFYMPTWAGVDPQTGAPQWYGSDGKVVNTFSEASYQKQGRSTPTVFGGINNNLSWKNFTLDVQLTYSIGGKFFDGLYQTQMHDGAIVGTNMNKDALNAWTTAGQETGVPKFELNNSTGSYSTSTRFLYDATNLRLRHISLGYRLPYIPYFSQVVSSAKVYVSGDNLFTLFADRGYKGYSDIDLFGVQGYMAYSSIPTPRSFTFGINLTF